MRVDDVDAAERLKRQAADIAREFSLRPEPGRRAETTSTKPRSEALMLRRDGDIWRLDYRGQSAGIKDSKGMQMLATLLAAPEKDIHVLDLVAPGGASVSSDSGSMLDDKARADYRQRVADLQSELEDAEAMGDIGRTDALRGELDFISAELSRAYGLGGRKRAAGSDAERARVNARRRIVDAIRRIGVQLPDAGRYLENTIKTGIYCRYAPL